MTLRDLLLKAKVANGISQIEHGDLSILFYLNTNTVIIFKNDGDRVKIIANCFFGELGDKHIDHFVEN
jgi:hypothetical protein